MLLCRLPTAAVPQLVPPEGPLAEGRRTVFSKDDRDFRAEAIDRGCDLLDVVLVVSPCVLRVRRGLFEPAVFERALYCH